MKKLLIGLLAIGTLSAQASMLEVNGPLDVTLFESQKTHFDTLGDLFKAGQLPDLKKISNVAWAGRCFFREMPNDPTNGGIIFRPKIRDVGPIGRTSQMYEAASYWMTHKDPNYFDQMNMDEVLATIDVPFNAVRIKSDSVEMRFQKFTKSDIKVSGNYLVEELFSLEAHADPNSSVARCYYFIPKRRLSY